MTRVLLLVVVAACYDPVHADAVAVLGPDDGPPGPNHRSGQPCLTCHGEAGPAELELSIGGTLYAVRGGRDPLDAAEVTLTDARGQARVARSNASGNFFIAKSDWAPAFPLRAAIEAEGIRREMATAIGRDGSCASCHRDGGDRAFMPGVFLRDK